MSKISARKKIHIEPNETKAQRFKRVVAPRVTKAVKAISVLGYCAGSTYEYTPEQIKQIDGVLSKAIVELLAKFASKASKADEFTFTE